MKSSRLALASCLAMGVCLAQLATVWAALPVNLAKKAITSATSEHNVQYLSKFAVDGRIPPAGSGSADLGAAWCVLKAESGDQADFTLEWQKPVEAAEIVYFGRTAWYMNECWKDFEVYLDDANEPAAKGSLKMVHGPQRIPFAKQTLQKITIKFLNSHGGMNPGAAEIMVFAESPSKTDLAKLGGVALPPSVDEADSEQLRKLIVGLMARHGMQYARGPEHLAQLDAIADDDTEALAELQRRVLLFDVDKLVVIKRHEITASHVYTYHYEGFQAGGGLYVVSPHQPDAEPLELVATPTGQILDCNLSYDGQTVLFSWRRTQDEGYHLWTVQVDGSDLKQLTDGQWHDYNACWLPDGDIAFLTTRAPQFAYCWHAPVGILHRMSPDGSNYRELSANYLNDFTPSVLDDGRIIYSRWEYVDRPAIPIQSLWTINPDGTGLSAFFGNRVLTPGTFMEARSIPGTTKIICTMTGHNGPARGAIGVIDRTKGVNTQAAIENITPDTPLGPVDEGNGNTSGSKLYSCPFPLDSQRFLVSAKGPVLVRTLDGTCQSAALMPPTDGMQWFSAQPIRSRNKPTPMAPKLIDETQPYATLYLQDVYNGLEPYVARGEVKSLRIVRDMQKTVRIDPSLRSFGFQFPVISCGATYAGKDVLGEVPVEEDGSACFYVPAHTPVYFMALDREGRAVQRMRSFTHMMPGEVQGCIGCHEHRQLASQRSYEFAVGRTPRKITPPEWGAGGFHYWRVVQPVLDKYCVECHDAVDAPKGIDLTGGRTDYFNVSYDVLAREGQGRTGTQYVNWIPTYNGQEWNILEVTPRTWGSPQSRLAEIVLSGHPDEKGMPRFEMDSISRRRIYAWIDLNVPYYGTSETAYPDMQGCRRIVPAELDGVLKEVADRRCAECHADGKIPRREWVRITEPQLNPFLVAPLAKEAGGSEKCGKAIFKDTADPDYQAIRATFEPIESLLRATPRMDMPGAEPSCTVSRSCQ
ncbi:MAG TPA: hypothetical protein VE890_03405 [Thermoguttaceae bacterium]|nr:hypothetical protein [Thermoguttaceae bacterium]